MTNKFKAYQQKTQEARAVLLTSPTVILRHPLRCPSCQTRCCSPREGRGGKHQVLCGIILPSVFSPPPPPLAPIPVPSARRRGTPMLLIPCPKCRYDRYRRGCIALSGKDSLGLQKDGTIGQIGWRRFGYLKLRRDCQFSRDRERVEKQRGGEGESECEWTGKRFLPAHTLMAAGCDRTQRIRSAPGGGFRDTDKGHTSVAARSLETLSGTKAEILL